MTHARRITPKKTSTKDMLENSVSGTSAGGTNTDRTNTGEAIAINTSNNNTSKATAFDEAFSKNRPFKSVLKGTRGRTSKARQLKKQGISNKFIKRLLSLAIVCVLVFVLLSMSFRTKEVFVEGNEYLSTAEVQMLSKIYAGTPLLWVSERNVKNLLRNPWVDNVKITKELPHTVLIKLSERVPVAVVVSNNSSNVDSIDLQNQNVYTADGRVLPNVAADVLNGLPMIEGWGEDRSLEGLELLNYFTKMPELTVTEINYTPEGFEASFSYGLIESASQETSFILGQLQTPSLTLLKEHWQGFVHALASSQSSHSNQISIASNDTGELRNMAGSLADIPDRSVERSVDRFIVPTPEIGAGQVKETGRIVKRKWITVYGWGVSLSE